MSSRENPAVQASDAHNDTHPIGDTAKPRFPDLVDVTALQSMMDDFYVLTRIPMSVVDLEGAVVVGAGWQNVCIDFHRANPQTCANCVESDTVLTAGIPAGESRLYQCKNGMWDAAMPVVVAGIHIANVFTGQFFFDDTPIDTDFFRAQAQRHGFDEEAYVSAVASVPRLSRATVQTGLDFLTKLSNMVSHLGLLALENARLYEAEHEIAETLQEVLVVLPTHVAGIVFSRAYRSATYQPGSVGGDFVDVFQIHDDLVGIALGDVSGKGIGAAVTTSLVRTTLRVHALDGLPPALATAKTNQVMRRFTETESYVTLWFGLLNTKTGLLRYVCAGHPPALILAPDGDIRKLDCIDPILGAFDAASYFESQMILGPGDRLILYSDGVTEARSPLGEFLNEEGLIEAVRILNDQHTSALSQAIMDTILTHSNGVLRDDAAVLSVEAVELGF